MVRPRRRIIGDASAGSGSVSWCAQFLIPKCARISSTRSSFSQVKSSTRRTMGWDS